MLGTTVRVCADPIPGPRWECAVIRSVWAALRCWGCMRARRPVAHGDRSWGNAAFADATYESLLALDDSLQQRYVSAHLDLIVIARVLIVVFEDGAEHVGELRRPRRRSCARLWPRTSTPPPTATYGDPQ